MTIRSASLLAAAALAALSAPALAQDYRPGPPPPLPEVDESWEGEWDEHAEEAYQADGEAWDEQRGPHADERYERRVVVRRGPMAEHGPRHGPDHGPDHGAGFAYPPEQRAQWLEQCRTSYRDRDGRARGQVIGGVLGAVAGGVIGREIAGPGDNLEGTLIGAGVGGLAGVAVGGAIGADTDRARFDECEAYLVRYEQSYAGYGHGYAREGAWTPGMVGYHYPYPYPVMWVKVPIVTERGDCGCETVVEEVVVEEAPPPRARRTKIQRLAPAPAPTPGKRVRIRK